MQKRAMSNDKIRFLWDSVIEEILGEGKVEGVRVVNVRTGEKSILACDGVFVAIGYQPNTKIFQDKLELDGKGYIVAKGTQSSVDGVFVAGDVHDFKYRQAVTAAGEGCKAAMDALSYLDEQKEVTLTAKEM
jgi:thioredoxin reductase (NADPH)